VQAYGIWHFSFTVSDLDTAIAFYCDLLGFVLVHRQTQDNAYTRRLVGYPDAVLEVAQLAAPGQPRGLSTHDLELVQYLAPDGRHLEREIRDPGQAHLAIAVDDATMTYERLTAAGIRFVTPPNEITAGVNTGGKACYFYGPDEIVHELLEPPPERRRAYADRVTDGRRRGSREVSRGRR
jgi:catechol 2,3-dioxygenase-like lactoylglutathione lyase family enzyme